MFLGSIVKDKSFIFVFENLTDVVPDSTSPTEIQIFKHSNDGTRTEVVPFTYMDGSNPTYTYTYTFIDIGSYVISYRIFLNSKYYYGEDSVDVVISEDSGTDILSELTSTPPATPTLNEAIMFLYMALRNRTQTTNSQIAITNSNKSIISKADLHDDGKIFTKDEYKDNI